MLSYWPCRCLNVAWQQEPPPPPLWERAAHPGPQVASTGFLLLLVGVVLNRRLQIAGIVRCVGGSRRCTPLVARDGLGLLVVSSRRRAELPLAVGVDRPEIALRLACLA